MTTTYRIRLTDKITADVTGDYYPAWHGTRTDPPEPESVTLHDVEIKGLGVINSLTDEQLQRIEAAWLRAFHDEKEAFIEQQQNFKPMFKSRWKR